MTDEQIAQAQARRLEWLAKKEAQRQEKIEELQRAAYWRGWHDAMDAVARSQWQRRGIPNEAQDYLELGYTNSPPLGGGGALTIPYHDSSWDVVNLQWRFVETPEKGGKYHNFKGLSLPVFRTETDSSSRNLLVVEGAIKASVVWWNMTVVAGLDYHVIGLPSATASAEVLDEAASTPHDRVYIMTDPDTYTGQNPAARRVGQWFDEPLYVTLPDKPDDLLNGGWTADDIERYIKQASYV